MFRKSIKSMAFIIVLSVLINVFPTGMIAYAENNLFTNSVEIPESSEINDVATSADMYVSSDLRNPGNAAVKELTLPVGFEENEASLTDKETVTVQAKVIRGEEEKGETQKRILFAAPEADENPVGNVIKENEIKALNAEGAEYKASEFEFSFTPESTTVYVIKSSGSKIPYINIRDNENKSLAINRTYPEMNDSVAFKFHKGQGYKIIVSSLNKEEATEISIIKYKSETVALTYNFEDNTYTAEDKASVIVTMPKTPADIYFDILDREMLIKAQLYKNGEMIEEIPNISSDCIRGGMGSPDDNVVQFACNFSKQVEVGEYTIKIDLADTEGNPVTETCEAKVMIGNPVYIYTPSGQLSYSIYGSNKLVYFSDKISNGKFIIQDEDEIVGTISMYRASTIDIDHYCFNSYMSSQYEYLADNFSRRLYYTRLYTININGNLEKDKEYNVEFLSGELEYKTPVKIISTEKLILDSMWFESLTDRSTELEGYAVFENIVSAKTDKLRVDLIDIRGNIIASASDYAYAHWGANRQQIKFRLKLNKPVDITNKYFVKISYLEDMYSNAEIFTINSYKENYNNFGVGTATVLDVQRALVKVPAFNYDKTLNYDVTLYRVNEFTNTPISEIINVVPDEDDNFILEFPFERDCPLLYQGKEYIISFKYTTSSNYVAESQTRFKIPDQSIYKGVNNAIVFDPLVLPSKGEVEFSISGYELVNGIIGADNENINIELVAENEIYGTVKKDTIKRNSTTSRSVSGYNVSKITVTGIMQLTKELKEETQYFIRINGKDYEYIFYSDSQPVNPEFCNIAHSQSTYSFTNSLGENQLGYLLSQIEPLELKCKGVKNVSEDMSLVLENKELGKEFDLGKWSKDKVYYDGEYTDLSIKADLSQMVLYDTFEVYLKAGEAKYSLNKFIKVVEPEEAESFSVVAAKVGSDVITVSIPAFKIFEDFSFDIKDSFDNIKAFSVIAGSEREGSNNTTYIDLKLDTSLRQGIYTLRMYNANKVLKYSLGYSLVEESKMPKIHYMEGSSPYIINCMNLVEDGVYTADISDYESISMIKRDVPLVKRNGENVLELHDSSISDVKPGTYSITVKVNGSIFGSWYFTKHEIIDLKASVVADEWLKSTAKMPFISSNSVNLLINTMNFTKVRYAESLESLQNEEYQTVTESVYYTFKGDDVTKILYFQFTDDSMKESELVTFAAYLQKSPKTISVSAPTESTSYTQGFKILATVANNPTSVWVKLYSISGGDYYSKYQTIRLAREADTDNFYYQLSYSDAFILAKAEFYSIDEIGNISDSKTVILKELPKKDYILSIDRMDSVSNKSKIIVSGKGAMPESNVKISAWSCDYSGKITSQTAVSSIKVIANASGAFEGELVFAEDGYYQIIVNGNDSSGSKTLSQKTTIDTTAPVLKDFSTVAQGNRSVKISWDVTDTTACSYTIWRDNEVVVASSEDKQYIAIDLNRDKLYNFKIMATDAANNKSELVEIKVTVGDNEAPSVPQNLHVSSHAGKSITLAWDESTDNSFVAGYEVMRDGVKVATTRTASYTDSNLITGNEYSYSVKAFDPSMNYSELSESIVDKPMQVSIQDMYDGSYEIVAPEVKKLEIKAMTDDVLNNSDIEVQFYYSKDDEAAWNRIYDTKPCEITPDGILFSAVWEIEDLSKGEYIIKYIAEDRDGLTSEAFSKPIYIKETNEPDTEDVPPDTEGKGTLNITVVDGSNNILPSADVYINLDSDALYKEATDEKGSLTLKLEPGNYKIGSYRTGYSPTQQEVVVEEGKVKDIKFVLVESQLVVGGISSQKMTLDEIQEAGIDLSEPGNRNVFRYEINLTYDNINEKMKFFAYPDKKDSLGGGASGGIWGGGGSNVGGRAVQVGIAGDISNPVILVLDLPGSVSWLKDFFDVKLQIYNTQGDYAINQGSLKLNLPEGLTLVGGNTESIDIGTIPSKETKLFNWVVRGDRVGKYDFSADFKGLIETFNEEISANFKAANPISVESSKGLKVYVEVERAKYRGDILLYRVGFLNEKNSEVNLPSINMKDSTFLRSYKTTESMSLVKTSTSVLEPGEILWKEFSIAPELYEGKNNVNLLLRKYSSEALNGWNIPIEIRPVEYGTFGRLKTGIFVMDPVTGREYKADITLRDYKDKNKKDDIMPRLKIKALRGIAEGVEVKEIVNITIYDNLYKTEPKQVSTDSKGEYIYVPQNGGSIEDIVVGESGVLNTKIIVDTQGLKRKVRAVQSIKIIDEEELPFDEFGTISGKVINTDLRTPIIGAKVIIGESEMVTNSNGGFRFEDIDFSRGIITIEAEGFPVTEFKRFLTNGSHYELSMSIKPEIKGITSIYSDSHQNSKSVLPGNLIKGDSIEFNIEADMKDEKGTKSYVCKIIGQNGVKRTELSSDSSDFVISKSTIQPGDKFFFAAKISGDYGTYTSDYVDSKLLVAPELGILDDLQWDYSELLNNAYNYGHSFINGLEDFKDFLDLTETLTGISFNGASETLSGFDLYGGVTAASIESQYDINDGKLTITTGGATRLNGNVFALLPELEDIISSSGFDVEGNLNVEFELTYLYDDRLTNWNLNKCVIDFGGEIIFTITKEIPADVKFSGKIAALVLSVELGGGIQTEHRYEVPIDGYSGSEAAVISDIIDQLMNIQQAKLSFSLTGGVGIKLLCGMLEGSLWERGLLEIEYPSGGVNLTISVGADYRYLWFFPEIENEFGSKTFELRKPDAAESVSFSANSSTPMFAPPTIEAEKDTVYSSSPRDYLKNQEWIGKGEILRDAYPQSDAQIASIDNGFGDLMMVFIGDDGERTENNRTSVQSSVYKDGTWSEPIKIDDDGTADIMPKLATDGEDIYAVWLDMTEEIGDLPEVTAEYITENIVGKMGISLSQYNKNTNSWEAVLSKKTEGLNKLPEVSTKDGKVMVTWVNNADKKIIGDSQSQDCVYYIYKDEKGWSEPKTFIDKASNVSESDLFMFDDKVYYVYVSDSTDGLGKLYMSCFDGDKWSDPEQLLENSYSDSNPVIELKDNKPMAFWKNDGKIYEVSLERIGNPQIIINSSQAENIIELAATNTESGTAILWTTVQSGEKRMYLSTFESESFTWTPGTQIVKESMALPMDITLAGLEDKIMVVYNESIFKLDEKTEEYYKDSTSLSSTTYVRKTDLAIPDNGIYFEEIKPLPGEETKVVVLVKNTGDLTVEDIKVSLYDGENLVLEKELTGSNLVPDAELLTDFEWTVPIDYTGFNLKAVVEGARDVDNSNNAANLEVLYTDAEITSIYSEVYSEEEGTIFVGIKNSGDANIKKATLTIASDAEFKNIIASKTINDLSSQVVKNVYFNIEPDNEMFKEIPLIYAKVETDSQDNDSSNNIDFTVLRKFEDTIIGSEEISISGYLRSILSADAPKDWSGFEVEVTGGMVPVVGKSSALTDSEGFFFIEGIEKNISYTVNIKKKGYLSRKIEIVNENENIMVGTAEKPIEMWIGDIDEDGAINMADIVKVATKFNKIKGDELFNADFDLNKDNAINMIDIMIIAKHFNSIMENYPEAEIK